MIDELLDFLKPREETVVLAGKKLIVRQFGNAADAVGFKDGKDALQKFIVRCTFDEAGNQVFTDDHIPALKAAPPSKIDQLLAAVIRVNGLGVEDEVKNSGAAPSSG